MDKTCKRVPIPKVGTDTHCIEEIGTGTEQGGTGTGALNNPVFVPLTQLSLVFVH